MNDPAARAGAVSMTTRQLERAALSVPCPGHHAPPGIPCQDDSPGGLCMTRRELADARRCLGQLPPDDQLARLSHQDVLHCALEMRDAALALDSCLRAALGDLTPSG
jgi:hypothetical protein